VSSACVGETTAGRIQAPPRPRRGLGRLLSALLVLRLEAREVAPLSAGLILLNWLHRPVIEMPLVAIDHVAQRREALRRRLDAIYPF
jgi:hypothetical protein